jgi:hypothetical protein
MDERDREILKFQLMEEIAGIEERVSSMGAPRVMAERSLIARYGKLLLVSQALLNTMVRGRGKPQRRGFSYQIDAPTLPVVSKPRPRSAFRRFS